MVTGWYLTGDLKITLSWLTTSTKFHHSNNFNLISGQLIGFDMLAKSPVAPSPATPDTDDID